MASASSGGKQQFFFRKKKKKTTKKKPQTLKKFFPIPKNWQGFDMHLCCYKETIRDYIFLPQNRRQDDSWYQLSSSEWLQALPWYQPLSRWRL
jgi:hypothetical protein